MAPMGDPFLCPGSVKSHCQFLVLDGGSTNPSFCLPLSSVPHLTRAVGWCPAEQGNTSVLRAELQEGHCSRPEEVTSPTCAAQATFVTHHKDELSSDGSFPFPSNSRISSSPSMAVPVTALPWLLPAPRAAGLAGTRGPSCSSLLLVAGTCLSPSGVPRFCLVLPGTGEWGCFNPLICARGEKADS